MSVKFTVGPASTPQQYLEKTPLTSTPGTPPSARTVNIIPHIPHDRYDLAPTSSCNIPRNMANYDTHVRRGQPVLFVFIVIFSIFELVNAAWLVSRFDLLQDYPSLDVRDRTRFLVFVTSWTILVSLIYFTLFLRTPENGIWTKFHSHAAVVGTTWIFWTTGAVAITVAVGGWLDCGSAVIMYCGPLNALEAFAWLSWTFVTFAFVVVLFRGTSLSGRSEGYQGFGSMG